MLDQAIAFKVLQPEDFAFIQQTATIKVVAADTVLIQEGKVGEFLYIVLDGTLQVSISQGNGNQDVEIARLSRGEIVGEMSFIDDRPPSATVKAFNSCQLLALPKQKLQLKVERDPDFAARFYHELAMKLSNRLRNMSSLLAQSKILPGQSLRKVLYLFAVLNDNDIDWLTTYGRKEKVPKGTVLIQQGEAVEAVYFLLKGAFAVVITLTVDGQVTEREIARRASGEIVGEMSFVEVGVASATIRCAENSFVLAIPQDLLREKLQRDRGFAMRFYRSLTIVLVDRLRDDLVRRGFGTQAYNQEQFLDNVEYEDEIPLDVLELTLLAGTRFKWMMNRLRGN